MSVSQIARCVFFLSLSLGKRRLSFFRKKSAVASRKGACFVKIIYEKQRAGDEADARATAFEVALFEERTRTTVLLRSPLSNRSARSHRRASVWKQRKEKPPPRALHAKKTRENVRCDDRRVALVRLQECVKPRDRCVLRAGGSKQSVWRTRSPSPRESRRRGVPPLKNRLQLTGASLSGKSSLGAHSPFPNRTQNQT